MTEIRILNATGGRRKLTMSQTQIKIKTNDSCCFCKENIHFEIGERESRSLPGLLHHLKIDPMAAVHDKDVGFHSRFEEMSFKLCFECTKISNQASQQFLALKKIQMELGYHLDKILKRIRNAKDAEIDISSDQSDDYSRGKTMQQLRKLVLNECRKLCSLTPQPRLALERMDLVATLAKHNLRSCPFKYETDGPSLKEIKEMFIVPKIEADQPPPSFPNSPVAEYNETEEESDTLIEIKIQPFLNDSSPVPVSEFIEIPVKLSSEIGKVNYLYTPNNSDQIDGTTGTEQSRTPERMNSSLCSSIFSDIVSKLKEQPSVSRFPTGLKITSSLSDGESEKVQKIPKRFDRKCKICQKTLDSTKGLLGHYKIYHPEKAQHKCVTCEKVFFTTKGLKHHQKFDSCKKTKLKKGNPRNKCSVCSKTFKSVDSRRYHYESAHLGVRHSCLFPGCSNSYKNKYALNRHKEFKHPHWTPPQ